MFLIVHRRCPLQLVMLLYRRCPLPMLWLSVFKMSFLLDMGTVLLWLVNVNREHNSCLIASLVKMQMLSMFTIRTSKFQNWWVLTNFRRSYIWLKYCRYGVKHYPINQLINQSITVCLHPLAMYEPWSETASDIDFEFVLSILQRKDAMWNM